ncbi:MAG: COX15/CtaA family protein [Saprospiraceae bacterium]|nr:COX15/CtaA family protein [Saprospiraceae bacterium]
MQASPYLKTPVKNLVSHWIGDDFSDYYRRYYQVDRFKSFPITKWDIVTGAIPPLNHDQWQDEFELYKRTPQYQKINQGMDLSRFKWIYFWEYHIGFGPSMGFVFLIPLVIFWLKGYLRVKD